MKAAIDGGWPGEPSRVYPSGLHILLLRRLGSLLLLQAETSLVTLYQNKLQRAGGMMGAR